jgi:transposase
MAYRYGDRKQRTLFPQSIDEYIPQDAPVRVYDVFVDSLNFAELGIQLEPRKVGCPQYDPKIMLKLLLYGYSYGVRSSRKLERESHYNLSFIWLTGGLKPDHKTIAEFRRGNKSALKKVLKQCARLCIDLGLIEGNTLFVDGSKVRANASIKRSWNKQKCLNHLKRIDDRISEILSECESVDQAERNNISMVHMKKELLDNETLKTKVLDIINELKSEEKKSTNTTDKDCRRMHGRGGSHAGYNMQSVVDEKHGLIINSDVVNENNDLHQFANQIEQAHKTLDKKCQTACADAGYADVNELEKIDSQGVRVIVPSAKQAEKVERSGPFDKAHFEYDKTNDCYICPDGKVLGYSHTEARKRKRTYRAGGSVCRKCKFFKNCTTNRKGRTITRLLHEEVKEKLEDQYEQPQCQEIYELRKQKVELPFGHIKHNLKVSGFFLRGFEGVKAEASILSSCFNIARMISIVGVTGLITKLGS